MKQIIVKRDGESFTLHVTDNGNNWLYMPLRQSQQNGLKTTGEGSRNNLRLMRELNIADKGTASQHAFHIPKGLV